MSEWAESEKLVHTWKKEIERKRRWHTKIAKKYSRNHYKLGISSTVMQSLVSFLLVINWSTELSTPIYVILQLMSAVGAVLNGLQTGIAFQEKAKQHSSAADSYESLYRIIDIVLNTPITNRDPPGIVLRDIQMKFDEIVRSSPHASDNIQIFTPQNQDTATTSSSHSNSQVSFSQVKRLVDNDVPIQRLSHLEPLKSEINSELRKLNEVV